MPRQRSGHRTAKRKVSGGMRYPIPQASARAWEAARSQKVSLNPGLIFDRFVPDWGGQAPLKKSGLEAVRDAANNRVDVNLLREWNTRWAANARAMHARPFLLKTDWRFIAGLGSKGPLEVGFTFHRCGFPILPGSSVKGLARAAALIEIAEKSNAAGLASLDEALIAGGEKKKIYQVWANRVSSEAKGLADDFRAVFGTIATAGLAVFLEAIPARKPRLELDVMNPHYPKYYSGAEFPTDWQNPVPVYFLTVAPDTEFRFAVGWRGVLDKENQRLHEQATRWLINGLTQLGAGAKTSAGYGYFVDFPKGKEQAPAPTPRTQRPSEETPGRPSDPHQQVVNDFVHRLQALPTKDVAGQIARFVDQWRKSQLPDEYRRQMAQAILDKVEMAKRTKKSQRKKWFQELESFVQVDN